MAKLLKINGDCDEWIRDDKKSDAVMAYYWCEKSKRSATITKLTKIKINEVSVFTESFLKAREAYKARAVDGF